MSKRKLNKQQLARIRHKQHALTQHMEIGDKPAETSEPDSTQGQPGLVISHFGQQLDIEALSGEQQGEIVRCHQRANLAPLVCGDRVVWQNGEPYGVVVAQQPRESELKRPTAHGGLRPVAANIDRIFIVIAPSPPPIANLIDRYLVAAEHSGIQPVLLLNKTDLLNNDNREEVDALLRVYRQIGYDCMQVSSVSGEGLDTLKNTLQQHISIFVGQSGVGKSALVNALLPEVNTLVGDISDANDKGKHTTTSARLFHFPSGGDLIDSPGIREFGLWHLDADTLLQGFVEFRPFLGQCRFRDCRHEQEPGCALQSALQEGHIDGRRLRSYQQILSSLDDRRPL